MNRDLVSALYVSTSTIPPSQADATVAEIIATAHRANSALHITGALVFTETRFAQVLEGPAAAVDRLMARIKVDPRHRDVLILSRKRISRRTFDRWNLAYAGPSALVARTVARPMNDVLRGTQPNVEALWALITELQFDAVN